MTTDPDDLHRRLARILWAYPAAGGAQTLLITIVLAWATQQGGLTGGGWAVATTAAAPLVGIPLTAAANRPGRARTWWPAATCAATAGRAAAVATMAGGAPLWLSLGLLFAGGAAHRVYAASFKSTVARLADGADQLAALNVRNGTAYAFGIAAAGWTVATLDPTTVALVASSVALALTVPCATAALDEGTVAPAADTPTFDLDLAQTLAGPVLRSAALWLVVAAFVRLKTPIATEQLGTQHLIWVTAAYTGSAWAARPLMARLGPRPLTFWGWATLAQVATWAIVDLHPWLMLAPLLLAGPTMHAGQAAIEHRIGTAVPPDKQATGFVIGNGALVLGGLAGAPLTGALIEHASYSVAAGTLTVLGAAALVAHRHTTARRHVRLHAAR